MSDTSPTPTMREVARDIVFESKDMDEMLTRIASALARERREALTEAAEVARNEMLNPAFEWREHNLACDVIARAIEAMRE